VTPSEGDPKTPTLVDRGHNLEECAPDIKVLLDVASVRAAFPKIKFAINTDGEHPLYPGKTWTALDKALQQAEKQCTIVATELARLCKVQPDAIKAKVKTVMCTLHDKGTDAPPEQDFAGGVWTVKYTWWDEFVSLNGIDEGLARALKLEPREAEPHYEGYLPRCSSDKECKSKEICEVVGGFGPRCTKGPRRAHCTKGPTRGEPGHNTANGGPFGHADPACPKGEWCSQFGVCFPKAEFPVRGRNLRPGSTCYFNNECASGRCSSEGGNQFSDWVGHCIGN
jgi:hypothetical protein